jgi:hypothetical protein
MGLGDMEGVESIEFGSQAWFCMPVNPSNGGAKTEGSQGPGQPGLQRRPFLKKKKKILDNNNKQLSPFTGNLLSVIDFFFSFIPIATR